MSEIIIPQPREEGRAASYMRRSTDSSFKNLLVFGTSAVLFPMYAIPIAVAGLAVEGVSNIRIAASELSRKKAGETTAEPKRRLALTA